MYFLAWLSKKWNIFNRPRTYLYVCLWLFKLIWKACFICKAYNPEFRLNQVGICWQNGEDLPTSRRADSDLFYLHGLTAVGFQGQLNLYVVLQWYQHGLCQEFESLGAICSIRWVSVVLETLDSVGAKHNVLKLCSCKATTTPKLMQALSIIKTAFGLCFLWH